MSQIYLCQQRVTVSRPGVGGPSIRAHGDVSQAVLRGQSQGFEQGGDLRMIRPLSEG